MPPYLPRSTGRDLGIVARQGNVMFMDDGNIWCLYLVDGPIVDVYSAASITSARKAHTVLFKSLSELGTDEVSIHGFQAKEPTSKRLSRAVRGVDNFSDHAYPELNRTLREYAAGVDSGMIEERRRIYLIAARVPSSLSPFARLSAQITGRNPFSGRGDELSGEVAEFNEQLREAIPDVFRPHAAPSDILEWVRRAHTLRGVEILDAPDLDARQAVTPQRGGFDNVRINPAPDAEATLNQAREAVGRGKRPRSQLGVVDYFRSLTKGKCLSIHNYEGRRAALPDGPVSYQALLGVTKYAAAPDYSINTLTSLADQANGLHGDFCIHLSAAPELLQNNSLNDTLKKIEQENASNSKSMFDTDRYIDRATELRDFSRARDEEASPTMLKVSVVFAFGSASLGVLTDRIRAIENAFSTSGYTVTRPIGGQEVLWDSMLPCVPSDELIHDLEGSTTAELFGSYAPIRRIGVGDGVGYPFGACIETALGSEVNIDLVNATVRGNGSIAFTGAQGSGKSYAMKRLVSGMSDLRFFTSILDPQGEWASYVRRLPSHQIVDLVHPKVSIDPLKVMLAYLGRDKGLAPACEMLHTLLLPMLGVKPKTQAYSALSSKLSPDYLESRTTITTTRELLEHLLANSRMTSDFQEAVPAMREMLRDSSMAAFVDPIIGDSVQPLPPIQIKARTVVFMTAGLELPPPDLPRAERTTKQSYAVMANAAAAVFTKWIFEEIAGNRPSAFVADEAWFLEDLDVLTQLVKEPDRTGRKKANFVIVGSQTGAELSKPEYKLIRRRVCMAQDSLANAKEALAWAGFGNKDGEVPESLAVELATDTSPLDSGNENRTEPGREGEAFFNDGTRKAKIKVYPELRADRAQAADTTGGRWQRYRSDDEGVA